MKCINEKCFAYWDLCKDNCAKYINLNNCNEGSNRGRKTIKIKRSV